MKKIITLMSVVALLFSCGKSDEGGFDSISIKEKIDKDLAYSKWVPITEGLYDTLGFYEGHIDAIKNGEIEHLAYHVTNVFGTQTALPEFYQLRLKSYFKHFEIDLKNNYEVMISKIQFQDSEEMSQVYYRRVN